MLVINSHTLSRITGADEGVEGSLVVIVIRINSKDF